MSTIRAADVAQAGSKYLGTSYKTMDCQAFVEACLRDAGLKKNLPGSNAWYRECIRDGWVGSPEECRSRFGKIPVGAFLFILETDGKEPAKYRSDGIGNASHIGIVTGTGKGAIHSSQSRGGVFESAFAGKSIRGGWNRVGLWRQLSYGDAVDRILSGDAAEDEEKGGSEVGSSAQVILPAGAVGSTVNLRARGSKSAQLIERVPVGSVVEILDDRGEWCRVRWAEANKRGWMMSEYLLKQEALIQEPAASEETGDVLKSLKKALRRFFGR